MHNFLLLFYSSTYGILYIRTWFFLINLIDKDSWKTGIGQSKYCIPQLFSRCFISVLAMFCCFFFVVVLFFVFFLFLFNTRQYCYFSTFSLCIIVFHYDYCLCQLA